MSAPPAPSLLSSRRDLRRATAATAIVAILAAACTPERSESDPAPTNASASPPGAATTTSSPSAASSPESAEAAAARTDPNPWESYRRLIDDLYAAAEDRARETSDPEALIAAVSKWHDKHRDTIFNLARRRQELLEEQPRRHADEATRHIKFEMEIGGRLESLIDKIRRRSDTPEDAESWAEVESAVFEFNTIAMKGMSAAAE